MSGIKEIKQAIDNLRLQERCELMAILAPPSYDKWDQQMMKDSEAGGKLDPVAGKRPRGLSSGTMPRMATR